MASPGEVIRRRATESTAKDAAALDVAAELNVQRGAHDALAAVDRLDEPHDSNARAVLHEADPEVLAKALLVGRWIAKLGRGCELGHHASETGAWQVHLTVEHGAIVAQRPCCTPASTTFCSRPSTDLQLFVSALDSQLQLDIECLGEDPTSLQFNAQVYKGATPPVTTPASPTQDPHAEPLGFDASADFHIYTIEWTPAGATFSIDDAPRYTWTRAIDGMKLPQNVLLTIWASASSGWAGPATDQTVGAAAIYDWIELYRYAAP